MVMGGNDGFNVLHDGTLYGPDTANWQPGIRAAPPW